ncbi:MAG: YlxR family protein [Deltaproteobacteria bacterium]
MLKVPTPSRNNVKRIAERTCVGCRVRSPQADMLRIQAHDRLGPVEVPGPGRSAYVHRRQECVEALSSRRHLERSLRHRLSARDKSDLAAQLLVVVQQENGRKAQGMDQSNG